MRACLVPGGLALSAAWGAAGLLLVATLAPPWTPLGRDVLALALGLGSAGSALFVMGPRRIASAAARPLPPTWLWRAAMLSLQLAAALGLAARLADAPWAAPAFAAAVALAAAGYVACIAWSLSRPRLRPRLAPPTASDRAARWLDWGSLAYLAAFAVAVAAQRGTPSPATWHLLLAGFVALTLQGCALHLLPRFFHQAPHATLARALVAPSLAGPALLALALDTRLLPLAGAVEGLGLLLFCAAISRVVAAKPRALRPLYAGALALVAAGTLAGALMGVAPVLRAYAGTHAALQLSGFGLLLVAITADYDAPWARLGAAAFLRHARALRWVAPAAAVGLAATALLQLPVAMALAAAALAAALGAQAVGFALGLVPRRAGALSR